MQVAIVDTSGVQPYVFGSNRLRENIGASHLVALATEQWAFDALPKPNNLASGPSAGINTSRHIERDGLAAEAIYAGGGNFVALFDGMDSVKQFASALSRRALEEAPLLSLHVVARGFQWSQDLRGEFAKAFEDLAAAKRDRSETGALAGVGVSAMCESSGLPATDVVSLPGGERSAAAPVNIAKQNAVASARARLEAALTLPAGFCYGSDFDELGRSEGENSHIAIVHADGDGVGQRMLAIGKDAVDNRTYIVALREFSRRLSEVGRSALQSTVNALKDRVVDGHIIHAIDGKTLVDIELKRSKDGVVLPIRPIVFGGDDVTWVCDGRLGVSTALYYMHAFQQAAQAIGGLTASAGVSIVKAHYPFAQAYDLAEQLSQSAKEYRRTIHSQQSYIDWHAALSGLSGHLSGIRAREYNVAEGTLTLRPVAAGVNDRHTHRSWLVVQRGIDAFQRDWSGKHNKVKALRDALRAGPAEVEHFRLKFNDGQDLPDVFHANTGWPKTGWHGYESGYFDAVEISDWFIPLEGAQA